MTSCKYGQCEDKRPAVALYEVQVWNVEASETEWSKLTTGEGIAEAVDEAEAFALAQPKGDEIRIVSVGRA